MMRWVTLGVCLLVAPFSVFAEPGATPYETNSAPGAPVIVHAPVSTAIRGVPARLEAKFQPQDGAVLTQTLARVRLELGAPAIDFAMPGPGEERAAIVPVSLVRTVQRFWYSISAWDSQGRVGSTIWMEVKIIDGAQQGGGAGAGATAWWQKPATWWVAGGLVAIGAGAAIIEHNNDDGGGSGGSAPPPAPPAPTPSNSSPRRDEPAPEPEEPREPRCITTGNETVTFDEWSTFAFDLSAPIELYLCNLCPNAIVRVVGTWGEEVREFPYNNPSCDPSRTLLLPKPSNRPQRPDEFTIIVYVNGVRIAERPWPSADELFGD